MNTAEKLPVENELQNQALTLYEQVLQIEVKDQLSYTAAGEMGSALKALEKKIVDYFAPLKKAAHEAHKAITKRETDELAPVKEAMDTLRKNVNKYLEDQERKRKEEEARLRRENEEAAERERQKLLNQAVRAEEKGNIEKAEEKLEQAEMVYTAPVVVPKIQTKTDNTTAQMETQITVTDLKAYVYELVKRGMAPTMLEIKVAPLKAWVNANAIETFPGLDIKKVPAVRFK